MAAAALALALPLSSASGQETPQSRIVGGTQTTVNEWPWQVALTINQTVLPFADAFDRQICGGSLIAPDLAITAYHCVDLAPPNRPEPPEVFGLVTGRTTLSNSSQGQEHDVEGIYYFTGSEASPVLTDSGNPLNDGDRWDAVVIDFAGAAVAPAAPIDIAGSGEEPTWAPGRPAVVTGWGTTSEGGSPSDTLREVVIEMLSDQTCENYSHPDFGPYPWDPVTMVCAGWLPGGRDTCQGDSGGPLVVPITGDAGFRLVGDTSFGDGCARANTPAVYGRLAGPKMRDPIGVFAADRGYDVIGAGGTPRDLTADPGPDPGPDPNPDPDPAPTRRCVVPNLKGRTVPAARRAARRRNCRVGRVTHRRSARIRRGRVMGQRPRRGSVRRAGFRIRIVVSSGRR